MPLDCTEATLAVQAACFRLPMDDHDRMAIRLWANLLELAEIGGTDFTTDIPALMEAACTWRKASNDLRDAMKVAIAIQSATEAGATVPADRDAWLLAVKCLRNYSNSDLDAMLGQVLCELGDHAVIT